MIVLGLIAGLLCALAVGLTYRLGIDDSLDVVGVNLDGGLVGTIGIGLFAADGGLLFGGGVRLLTVPISPTWRVMPSRGPRPRPPRTTEDTPW